MLDLWVGEARSVDAFLVSGGFANRQLSSGARTV